MEITTGFSTHQDAWQMVLGQLNAEMTRADFKTWVASIEPIGFNGNPDKFKLAVKNDYNKQFLLNRLNSRISRLLSGLYKRDIEVEIIISNQFHQDESDGYAIPSETSYTKEIINNKPIKEKKTKKDDSSTDDDIDLPATNKRKIMLQRAYGSERANIVQPERGLFVTNYFFYNWLPLLGPSAYLVVETVRRICYWNIITGEKRNIIETEMGDIAKRACISLRTLKTVLKNDLIKRYFIRYTVRRVMTPNGIRTAGIRLQVRMDDPLTPQDQEKSGIIEDGTWFSPEFEDESEEYEL